MFNWAWFWEDHPKKTHDKTILWANLRPSDYDYKASFDNINKLMKFKREDAVIEVGCGTFELYPYLKEKSDTVAGVDWSKEMVQLAINKHKATVTHSSAHNMTMIYDGQFNKVITMALFQYIPPDLFESTFEELIRITSPGGLLLLGDLIEISPKDSEVYGYKKAEFEEAFVRLKKKYNLKSFEYAESIFEKRPHMLIRR
jgi:ubiquinone/menaquinone biosynthesis C-methylase UbiE